MIAGMPQGRVRVRLTRLERWVLLKSLSTPPLYDIVRDAVAVGDWAVVRLTAAQMAAIARELDGPPHPRLLPRHLLMRRKLRKRFLDLAQQSDAALPAGLDTPDLRPLGHPSESGSASPEEIPPDVKKAVAEETRKYNEAPQEELGGLSPDHAHDLLYSGWWKEPYPVRLNSSLPLPAFNASPFVLNARSLLQTIADKGELAATPKKNLSRPAVARLLEVLALPEGFLAKLHTYSKVINEMDVLPLHIVRTVCELAGLVRCTTKAFVLTRRGSDLVKDSKAGELCAELFHAHFRKFNLAYTGRLPACDGVQMTFAYSLFKLARLGNGESYTVEGLVPRVLLPKVQEEIQAEPLQGPLAEWLLESRILRPLEGYGLLSIQRVDPKDHSPWLVAVEKRPLFDQFVRINVP